MGGLSVLFLLIFFVGVCRDPAVGNCCNYNIKVLTIVNLFLDERIKANSVGYEEYYFFN